MSRIVECVPNFSEGRRPEVIEKIVEAIRSVPGAFLLDQEMDANHNRAVITIAGAPEPVMEAAFRSIAKAAQMIDLNQHKGEHPRMGATDVCPFIPVQGVTMEECVELAHRLGKRVGEELGIPVFLYEEAATKPERKNLANVREGQFEKLKEVIGQDPSRTPDYGPNRIHPTAGAMAIGARFFLIAYNVNLNTQEVKLAKKIAKSIREKDGGFPCVKALGFALEDRKLTQVSMNLTDYRKSSMKMVFDEITRQATQANVSVAESEIVGLVPSDALESMCRESLKLAHFTAHQIIEHRLYQTQQDPLLSPEPFLDATSSEKPTPGGGSAAALAGALAGALARMVMSLTLQSKKYKERAEAFVDLAPRMEQLQRHLFHLVKEDSEAYHGFIVARKMKNETPEEQKARKEALENSTMKSILVPMDTMRAALEVLQSLPKIAEKGNPNAVSDAGVSCHLAMASLEGAMLNVRINLGMMKDEEVKDRITREASDMLEKARTLKLDILQRVEGVLIGSDRR